MSPTPGPASWKAWWVSKADDIPAAVSLFVSNIDANYISHGEVMEGRAIDFNTWSSDIRKRIHDEFESVLRTETGANEIQKLACLKVNNSLCGVSLLALNLETMTAVLEDIVVDKSVRGQQLGKLFLEWIESEMKSIGMKRLFLESGIRNEGAHHFFERAGFRTTSIVMAKEL